MCRFLCLTSSELWSRPPAHICQPEAAGAAGGAAAGGNTDCDGEQSGQTGQRQNCRWNIWTSSWSVCFLSIRTNLTNNLMNVQRLSDSKPHQDVLVFQIWYFHSYVSRKADWRLLFSCKEESFQSPEQKTQPGEYSSSLLNMIKGFLFECHAENASCVIIFCVKVPKSDEEYDLRVPRDMAYIFSGAYVPLSCRLIEQVSELFIPQDRTLSCWQTCFNVSSWCSDLQVLERDGWTGLEEVTRLLNGHEFAVSGSNTRRYSYNVLIS